MTSLKQELYIFVAVCWLLLFKLLTYWNGIGVLLNLFLLLYDDDTVIMAENEDVFT